MSTDQLPSPVADPEAPYGRRPDGTPYKRDPGPFKHLRGKPFGSLNGQGGQGPKAPTPRAAKAPGKARASVKPDPKDTAEGYAKRIRRAFVGLAKLFSRRAPVHAAIVAVRAPEMAEAWGRAAVSYPAIGRTIDRFAKSNDLGAAVGSTVVTLAMLAHASGLTSGPFSEMLQVLCEEALADFAASTEGAEAAQNAA